MNDHVITYYRHKQFTYRIHSIRANYFMTKWLMEILRVHYIRGEFE